MCYLNNICFVCLSAKDELNTVFHKETDNEIFAQVKYALPELMIMDFEIPVYICSPCHATLRSFYSFKKACLANYNRLKHHTKTLLQETNGTQIQTCSEFQNVTIKCEPLVPPDDQDVEMEMKEENEDPLLVSNRIGSELEIQLIKHDPDPDVLIDNEDTLLSSKEQNDQKTAEDSIDVKDKSLESEDSEDRELYQHFVKCETVYDYDDEQDGGSSGSICPKGKTNSNIETDSRDSIDVKDESLESENNEDRELYQHFVKCETVYDDDEQDGGSSGSTCPKGKTNSNIETDSREFLCSVCNQVFSDKLTFNIHTSIHIKNIKGLECSICQKTFAENISLKIHMRYHLGIKDYECKICNKKYSDSAALNKHLQKHDDTNDLECSICKKKFTQKWNLNRHMKYHLGIKDFECTICSKKFTESGGLNKHMIMHGDITLLNCKICKTKFTQSCKLKKHMQYHEGDTNFECSICNKNFTTRYTLNLHMKMHEGIKDYECEICKKTFLQNKYYKIHMKLHSGIKDFQCTFCDKKFLYNHTLKRHVNINHIQKV